MSALLIVDDDPLVLEALETLLARNGHEVTAVTSGVEASAILSSEKPFDLLLTDIRMESVNGLDLIDQMRRERPTTPVLVVSAYLDDRMIARIRDVGCRAYLAKPFQAGEVIQAVRMLLGAGG